MSLEARAARAARSLRASVGDVAPVGMPAVARRQRASMVTSFAAAGAMVLAVVGAASAMPSLFENEQVVTSGTSIPDPDGTPLVVEPDDKQQAGELVDLEKNPDVVPVHQTNSESDSPSPWTKFYGEAPPGTTVSAVSDWGSVDLVVEEPGEFSLKLWFEPLPTPGVEFPILVTVGGSAYEFYFTSLFDPNNADITAQQLYGTSDDAEAYDKFYGTAPPGLVVSVESAYGSAATTSTDDGEWELKVWFDDLTPHEVFDITVRVGAETFAFTFVSTFEPVSVPASIPLSISQVNTTSESSSPYVQFVGTAPAGTQLKVQSPFGSQSLTVGSSGEFSLKLWFSSLPPAGDQFTLTVKVEGSTFGTYPFTSYYVAPSGGGGEVSVSQYNTESWDADPWAKFNVSGPVGTVVEILSPYGSTSRTMASTNEYVKLWFSSLPPAGVEFALTVKINGETQGTYAFTSYYDPENVTISVSQYNTESWDADPWAKFNVSGPVGTVVEILSPYGSTSRTMASTNEYVKLWFSSLPPAGVEFALTVKINGEAWGTYAFTSWYEAAPPPAIAKTANNTYGTCALDPPYDIYYGTAPEGTAVTISSPYGSGATTADGSGNWTKQVFFAGATLDEPFTVTVDVGGSVFSFQMVVTA